MVKKPILIALIFLFLFSFASPVYCDDALKKLGRGIANSLTFPLELIEQPKRANTSDGIIAGYTVGILKGVGMAALRAVVGVYEIATFPIPFPRYYKPILTDPEFFYEEMNW